MDKPATGAADWGALGTMAEPVTPVTPPAAFDALTTAAPTLGTLAVE